MHFPNNGSPDVRIYATVFNSDHSLQYTATVTVCLLATPLNFLMLYLYWKKNKTESFYIKLWGLVFDFSLYLSQLQLGVFGGIVTLYPFPAMYCQGLLSSYFDAFTLFIIWALCFCTFIYSSFMIQLIRLQVMAKQGGLFDCNQFSYYVFCGIIAILVYVPVPSALFLTYSTQEEIEDFVKEMYPNNLKVLEYPGVYILTDSENQTLLTYTIMLSTVLAFLTISFIYAAMYWETRENAMQNSLTSFKEKMQKLRNVLLQIVLLSSFVVISIFLIFKSLFNDPSFDSRLESTIAYSCLCGVSIPIQFSIITRKTEYVNFVLRRETRNTGNQRTSERRTTAQN